MDIEIWDRKIKDGLKEIDEKLYAKEIDYNEELEESLRFLSFDNQAKLNNMTSAEFYSHLVDKLESLNLERKGVKANFVNYYVDKNTDREYGYQPDWVSILNCYSDASWQMVDGGYPVPLQETLFDYLVYFVRKNIGIELRFAPHIQASLAESTTDEFTDALKDVIEKAKKENKQKETAKQHNLLRYSKKRQIPKFTK